MPRRILLADDQLATRHVIQFNLEQAGFEVLVATDGMDAWKILQEQRVHLLVTDENMPRLSGTELCAKLRQTPCLVDLPVIMITAQAPALTRQQVKELGISHCFSKPFSPRGLVDRIREDLSASSSGQAPVGRTPLG